MVLRLDIGVVLAFDVEGILGVDIDVVHVFDVEGILDLGIEVVRVVDVEGIVDLDIEVVPDFENHFDQGIAGKHFVGDYYIVLGFGTFLDGYWDTGWGIDYCCSYYISI